MNDLNGKKRKRGNLERAWTSGMKLYCLFHIFVKTETFQNVRPPTDLAMSLRAKSPEAPSENTTEALTHGHN